MGLDCLVHGHNWQESRCAKYGINLAWKKKSMANLICKQKGYLWTCCRQVVYQGRRVSGKTGDAELEKEKVRWASLNRRG